MRQNTSDYIFNVANRAYFDKFVRLTPCVQKVLGNELRVVDMSKVKKMFRVVKIYCYVTFMLLL